MFWEVNSYSKSIDTLLNKEVNIISIFFILNKTTTEKLTKRVHLFANDLNQL